MKAHLVFALAALSIGVLLVVVAWAVLGDAAATAYAWGLR